MMAKWLFSVIIAITSILTVLSGAVREKIPADKNTSALTTVNLNSNINDSSVSEIRVTGGCSDREPLMKDKNKLTLYPPLFRIGSVEEAAEFQEQYTHGPIAEAMKEYDNSFFDKHILYAMYVSCSSGNYTAEDFTVHSSVEDQALHIVLEVFPRPANTFWWGAEYWILITQDRPQADAITSWDAFWLHAASFE